MAQTFFDVAGQHQAQNLPEDTRKRAREILRAYRHSWDIYSELLQNSVDAINRRWRILNDPDFYLYNQFRTRFSSLASDESYEGRINITVNISDLSIEVSDNGVGIEPTKIIEFLLPEGSDKKVGKEYGFKGFGLTYIGFISQEFYIASKPFYSDSPKYEYSLYGLFDWTSNEDGTIPFPNGPIPMVRQISQDNNPDWNTTIRVKLAENYSIKFPALSSAESTIKLAQKVEAFEYVLRAKTAIGNTRSLFNKAPIVQIVVTLNIINIDGTSKRVQVPYRYYHPKEHQEANAVAYDFSDYVEQMVRSSFERKFRCLFHTVSDVNVGIRNTIKCDFALAAISTTRLNNIEEQLGLADLEDTDIKISYGVHLSINGMPTGLRVDNWETKGGIYKRYFVIVDADLEISSQLDPGRKGISGHYAQLISDKALNLISDSKIENSDTFSIYASRFLDLGRGREEGGLPPQDFRMQLQQIYAQGRLQEEHQEHILKKIRTLSSLKYIPTDEQEVIVLFYELLQQNFIKGYKTIYQATTSAVYDAAFDCEIECVANNLYPDDPIGVGQVLYQSLRPSGQIIYKHRDNYSGMTNQPELCVEFKKSVGAFLTEVTQRLGSTNKDPKLMDLLITWNIDIPASINSAYYTIDPIAGNRRYFHATTHKLGLPTLNTDMYCIVLEDVIEKIHLV